MRTRRRARYYPGTMRRLAAVLTFAMAACASSEVGSPDGGGGNGDGGGSGIDGGGGCDGLPCDAVYVATTGNDGAPGTKEAPRKTISSAIELASSSEPARAVLV